MGAVLQEAVTLTGELAAWRNFSEGWGFGELRTAAETVPFTGSLVGVRVGETVEIVGVWTEHPRYGRQLKVRSCTAGARPNTAEGTIAWLTSTLPDVGERRARALVERFGAELWYVISFQPERLTEVDGITPKRADAIRASYRQHESDRDSMIALRGWGLTDSQIARCIAQWGAVAEVVDHIRDNPYELSSCVHGFGFLRADKVASKAGVAHDAPERVRAGVEYLLEEASGAGHCFMSGGALQKMASALLGVTPALVATAIKQVARGGRAVRHGWRVYPRRLDAAEEQCAQGLARLIARCA